MRMYSVKVKISCSPKNGTKFKNRYLNGFVFSKTPTRAKEITLSKIKVDEHLGVIKEVVSVKNINPDFMIDENQQNEKV